MQILETKQLNDNTYSFWIECDFAINPGQFVQIKADNATLRRPISVCDYDAGSNKFRIVFEVRGKGTEWIANKKAGDELDIIAPLGNSFPEFSGKKIVIVGGGIGVPPLLYLAKSLSKNNDVTAILGFRSEERVILKEEFEAVCKTKIMIEPKLVTDAFGEEKYDYILSCGAKGMYKAIEKLNIPTFVSLEERMGCGYGACYGCSVRLNKPQEEYARVCHDGPVFDLKDIVI